MTNGVQTVIKNSSLWRRRSTLEKTLLIISFFGILAIIALVISLIGVISNEKGQEKTSGICSTPGCIHTASNLFNLMDTSVDPCDDFYSYACGSFVKNTVLPDEKTGMGTFSRINDKLMEQLRALISEQAKPGEPKPFKLVKDFYNTCMNRTAIEEKGLTSFKEILQSLRGWPVVVGDSWDSESSWNWIQAVKEFRKVGYSVDYVVDFSISADLKESLKRVINVDQSLLGLDREFLIKGLDDKVVKAYYDYMVDIAVIYGAERGRATRDLLESLNFEIALANISLPREKRRNSTALYNPYKLNDVQKMYPYIPWVEYINALLPNGLRVDENEVINIRVPTFFEKLGKLLEQTPKKVIANYLMWRITAYSSKFLTEELRKRQLLYSSVLSGEQEQEPRWEHCVGITNGRFSISVGALYVRKHFHENSKQTALEMVNGIRKEFEKILREVPWMDETTRASALSKLHSISAHIGYPDELLDDKKLEEYYNSLEIDSNDYLKSELNINVFYTDNSFNKLRKPVNKTDWVTHAKPAIVNAFYSSLENSIQFPAGILQGQFFSADRPRYMNYGAIGFVIGHEITHGFDDKGSQFDLNGNLVDWWQSDTKTRYLEKAKCIVEQYGNYTEPTTNLKLNGVNTQGENIADNGGIKESYNAYQQWVKENGPEPKLPGVNLTPQQLFWLSAAQTWCTVYRTETMKVRILTGVHSPGRFRVLGPLSNMRAFAKDYNCPVNSPMNPTRKCEVW